MLQPVGQGLILENSSSLEKADDYSRKQEQGVTTRSSVFGALKKFIT